MDIVVGVVAGIVVAAFLVVVIGFTIPWWCPYLERFMDWVERQSNRVPARKRKDDEVRK